MHKAPEITSVSVIENNTQLTGLGVDNNTIVQYLSNKKFTVTATYDNATNTDCSIYHNNVLIGTSTTNEVIVDFGSVAELITSGTDCVGLNIAVKDSKEGYSTRMFNFSVIKYTRPTIELTSTTIVRKTGNGTVLTDNIAVLNFVGTCYKGNDVIGNANEPTIQYKIWSGTEPDYTTITTPNVANVNLKDYEINDILYTSVYDYKINKYDVFTKTVTTTNVKVGRVPTGKSVWSEYKDRVDFEKITIKNNDVFSYSSEEMVVGTWIDGKPIYRRYYEGSTTTGTNLSSTFTNDDAIENLIKCYGHVQGNYGEQLGILSDRQALRMDASGKTLTYYFNNTDSYSYTYKIVIEYTKRND